ncbi:MAG: recombinase family protein [Clostridia bacterium]
MDLYDIRNLLNSGKTIFDLPLKVTYYARVSTGKDEQAHSLQNQIGYYNEFINKNVNWSYVDGYIDEATSGTSVTKRDAFLRMIEDAKLGKFDFIITKEISRFSRNTIDSIKYTQELLGCGVGVLFQSDNINTLMPDSEMRLTIMSSIAQDEVRKLSERVSFGFKRAVENGVVLGNSRIWGYKKLDGKLIIDEEQAEVVREIFNLYAIEKKGIRGVATELTNKGFTNTKGNSFSFSTIKGILTNPKYKGYYCGNKTHKYDYRSNDRKYMDKDDWVMYKDEKNVPPIVSEELWDKANDILQRRSDKVMAEDKTSYQNKYAYSGKIYCGEHNIPYYRSMYKYKSGNREVWHCREYVSKGKAGCTMPTIYTDEIEKIMHECYGSILEDKEKITSELVEIYSSIAGNSQNVEDIAKCEVKIKDISAKKDKLLDLSIKELITDGEFKKRNEEFNSEVDSLKIKILDLKTEQKKNNELAKDAENLRKVICDELDFKDGFDVNIVDTLLEKIVVHRTDTKNIINLDVIFKVLDTPKNYVINRKNKTIVCTTLYI